MGTSRYFVRYYILHTQKAELRNISSSSALLYTDVAFTIIVVKIIVYHLVHKP